MSTVTANPIAPAVSAGFLATSRHSGAGRKQRSAVLVSADAALRASVGSALRSLRWTVEEASGAAEMFALLEGSSAGFCFVDSWLPDLEVRECVRELALLYPEMDVLSMDGAEIGARAARSPLRTEALYALQQLGQRPEDAPDAGRPAGIEPSEAALSVSKGAPRRERQAPSGENGAHPAEVQTELPAPLPEFIGSAPELLEVSRRIRLVAHRKTPVLVHGATGTGKELVARALHRLSGRAGAKFVAINCAAIPEALVEAELFGHARGAFTGASGSRVGRIEAAAGGTLFLDEIGELPLLVQSKLLRFLESGEIQRVGENEAVRVDVRVVAATHRKLGAMAREGTFRLDLLQRLSVFLIQTPTLAGRTSDIDALLEHGLAALGAEEAPKRLSAEARGRFHAHSWPGNVRELQHTLERAWILAGPSPVIGVECMDFGEALY